MVYDYLIIGQGLAGSAVAIQLLKRNRRFMVIDLPDRNKSSVIAAGIYNPITGKNWVKTWKADSLFPYMHSFYKEVEELTGRRFLYDKLIYRPFTALSQQNDWMGRSEDPLYRNYIEEVVTEPFDHHIIHNPIGGLKIKSGGYLEITEYLKAVKSLLGEKGIFKEELFSPGDLKTEGELCIYKGQKFNIVIFCEGPDVVDSEFWNFLPFRPVKGEILTISVNEELRTIYNKGIFILPLGNGLCRIGATYDYRNMESEATEQAKNQLINKLNGFFMPSFLLTDQKAGIRPATIDRKPILGRHPNDEKLVIFNGLGTKGVTLAPFFADHLLDYLENDSYLLKDVEINRFIK